MTPKDFLNIIEQHYQKHSNAIRAEKMSDYMRNLFPFLGIYSPQRKEINRTLFTFLKNTVNQDFLEEMTLLLFQKEEREYHYFALDLLAKYLNLLNERSLDLVKQLAIQHPWWDSIDFIATKIVSKLISKYPALWESIDECSVDDHLWLRRIAIICQIPFKKKTDEKRLFQYCVYNAEDRDFFIRKAIGWALREYAKTNPTAVVEFVNKMDAVFSNLTKKEALRRLRK